MGIHCDLITYVKLWAVLWTRWHTRKLWLVPRRSLSTVTRGSHMNEAYLSSLAVTAHFLRSGKAYQGWPQYRTEITVAHGVEHSEDWIPWAWHLQTNFITMGLQLELFFFDWYVYFGRSARCPFWMIVKKEAHFCNICTCLPCLNQSIWPTNAIKHCHLL